MIDSSLTRNRLRPVKGGSVRLLASLATMVLVGTVSGSPATAAVALPDLVVSVAASPTNVQPGATFQWALTVTNSGAGDAGTFDVTLPGAAAATGSGWTCVQTFGGRGRAAQSYCRIAGLVAGASSTITLPAVAQSTAGSYPFSATVDALNIVGESNEANNVGNGAVVVVANAPYDFVVTDAVSAQIPNLPTEPVTYTSSVANIGPYPGLTTVTLTNKLPIGFSFVSWTGSVFGPTGVTPGSIVCTPSGDPSTGVIVTCTDVPNSSGPLAPTAQVSIVALPPAATGSVDYVATNIVTVDPNNAFAESNEANNTATVGVRISNMLPDLALSMSTNPTTVDPGGIINHSITITNNGTGVAPSAVLRFSQYAGAWIGGGNSSVVCGVLFTTRSGATRGCTAQSIAPGASVTFPFQLLASGIVGTTTTSGTVTANVREIGSLADNSASTTASVAAAGYVDLAISATTNPTVAPGQPTFIAINVANNGIGVAAPTTVDTQLPPGFVFDAASSSAGCSAVSQLVSCPLGTTDPGRSQSLVIGATTSLVVGSFTASAVIDPQGVVAETNETNNTVAAAITVSSAFADFTTSITGPTTVASNGKPTFAITVANIGNVSADGQISIRETGFDRIDNVVAPAGWTCAVSKVKNAGNFVNCVGPAFGAGSSAVIQVTAAGSYAKGATAVTATVDPGNGVPELSETNNNASFTTTIV